MTCSIHARNNGQAVRWGLRCFPMLRLPEFVMGMALALRVNDDKAELDAAEHASEHGREDDGGARAHPRMVAGFGPVVVVVFAGMYYLWKVVTWPEDCACLPGDTGENISGKWWLPLSMTASTHSFFYS